MKVSERIRASGLTDKQLVELTGAHVGTVNRWRHGLKQPGAQYVQDLAVALGCDPRDLRPDLADLARIFAR